MHVFIQRRTQTNLMHINWEMTNTRRPIEYILNEAACEYSLRKYYALSLFCLHTQNRHEKNNKKQGLMGTVRITHCGGIRLGNYGSSVVCIPHLPFFFQTEIKTQT